MKWVQGTTGSNDVVVSTSAGQAVRFNEKDVRAMGRAARGVRGARLRPKDEIVGMDIINRGDFAVSNFKGQTVFSFRIPSEQKTSYVKDIRINNIVGKPHGKGNSKKRHKKKKK